MSKEVIGENHPETIGVGRNIAYTNSLLGLYAEAEDAQIQVVHIRKRVLGQEQPQTIRSMVDLSETWRARGRYKEAEERRHENP